MDIMDIALAKKYINRVLSQGGGNIDTSGVTGDRIMRYGMSMARVAPALNFSMEVSGYVDT